VDDVVDEKQGADSARQSLNAWRHLLHHPAESAGPGTDPAIWIPLQEALSTYSINPQHLLDLIDGVERDLSVTTTETFEELKSYCRGVASTVGLACLPLFYLEEDMHRDFAVHLGIAVQLTNILRDLGVDAARGRVYLPREDLRRFEYGEEDLKAGLHNPNFVRLIRFQVSRAREFYVKARQCLPPLSHARARPALIMGEIYRRLLEKIAKKSETVFGETVRLSSWEKIQGISGAWF
jgi:phytoene synthase